MTDTQQSAILSFIGGGNMTRAIVSGLILSGYNSQHIWVMNRSADKLSYFDNTLQVHVTQNMDKATQHADIIFLAVKPHQLADVCHAMQLNANKEQQLVSLAAGVRTDKLHTFFNTPISIIRAMPNLPVAVRAGATALYADEKTNHASYTLVHSLFSTIGIALTVDQEEMLDSVTALSGSGPAFVYHIMAAMESAAITLGLPQQMAIQLTAQTVYGAALNAIHSEHSISSLQNSVTSARGTTAAGLAVLQNEDIQTTLQQAILAAHHRAKEISHDKN